MHEKERVCPKLDPWGTPVLIAHSENKFLYKLIRSILPLRNDEIC